MLAGLKRLCRSHHPLAYSLKCNISLKVKQLAHLMNVTLELKLEDKFCYVLFCSSRSVKHLKLVILIKWSCQFYTCLFSMC